MRRTRPLLMLATAGGIALAASGCTQLRAHQGYIVDSVLLDSVEVGIDNKASVERVLGRPTFAGQFHDNDWYYLSRNTRQLAFASPRATDQLLIHIRFDAAGNVASVQRTGAETIARISPNSDQTPTLGRDRSFFEELFGNIGAVGAAGAGGPGGGAGGGGGQ